MTRSEWSNVGRKAVTGQPCGLSLMNKGGASFGQKRVASVAHLNILCLSLSSVDCKLMHLLHHTRHKCVQALADQGQEEVLRLWTSGGWAQHSVYIHSTKNVQ